jgi:spore germination cell wall hydrolase CwlJ-like protein
MKKIFKFLMLLFKIYLIILVTLIVSCTAFVCADYDQTVVATTLILEAGGEYDEGSLEAVYEVIHNRAIKKGKSYSDICLARKQFSCWNDKNIMENIEKASKHPRWNEAMKIAYSDPKTNYTKGADHYHADYVSPYWKDSMTKTIKIGRHIFYKRK